MALTRKQHRRGGDFNGLDITDVGSVQVNQDATLPSELVRKSQVESIAQDTVESNLITHSGSASLTTAFTSQSMVSFLSAKQDNMSIDVGSTAYLEIVDGTKIKVKQLLAQSVTVDDVSNTLVDYLVANPVHGLDEGDILILTAASVNQERSWIHNGGSAGDATDFTKLVTDYNQASIRAMFSSSDDYILYDNGGGSFSLNLGTGSNDLGAQTIPVNSSEFNTVNGTTVLAVLKALETYITTVDNNATGGSATLDTRLTSLSGVSGNNMGNFASSTFPDNSTIKQVLEASLAQHTLADNDRASIRAAFASADATLQSAIDGEVARSISADVGEAIARSSADAVLQSAVEANANSIVSEAILRTNADNSLVARLDTIEGGDATVGSIAHSELQANNYTDTQVSSESLARIAADAVLNTKIDSLAEGDITFVGVIAADTSVTIRADRIAVGDTRNGQLITNINLEAGETFVIGEDVNISYPDAAGGFTTYEKGDKLMVTEDVASGSLLEANINAVAANATGLSLVNVGSSTIEMDINDDLDIIADSITRNHLVADVEADIDDKRSLTVDNAITSDSDTHFVTDVTTGATQNMYYKRTSNTSDALTGTKRAVLAELHVSSNGSGNPVNPSYAHTSTYATHYNGSCSDMSLAIGGTNSEAVVNTPTAAVYATGQYSLAISPQLGVNAGVTGVAQNAGVSNIGITGFGKAGGIGKDRGGVFAISDQDFLSWAAYRSVNPITYPDAALVADAGTSASGKALVAVGDSIFEGGSVTVPTAVDNTDAVNLGLIKSKEFSQTVAIPANGSVVINHALGSKKILVSIWYEDELVTDTFDVDERTDNSFTVHNGTATTLLDVDINILRLS